MSESEKDKDQREFSLLEALEILVRYRRLIVGNMAIVTILAVIISLVLPKWYKSTAVILPPESTFDPLVTMGAIQRVAATANLPWFATKSDVYGAVLNSRYLSEKIIERFDLMRRYESETLEAAIREFERHRWIRVTDEGLIEISAEARNPELAAEIANSALEFLDEFNQNKQMTEGKKTLLFVEKRLNETRRDLEAAETTLRDFQEQYGAVELTVQTEALITAAAEIETQIQAIDLKLTNLTSFASESFPEVKRYRAQRQNLEEQLNRLVGDDAPEPLDSLILDEFKLSPTLRRLPDVGIRYLRLRREVELLSNVYAFLAQELERSKILATRDTPTIQLLDGAAPPEKKHRPKRTLIVVTAFLAAFLGSVVLAFGLEYANHWRRKPDNHRRLTRIIGILRADWPGRR